MKNNSLKRENHDAANLLQEASILSGKIDNTVDRLWKIRGFSLSLWFAANAVGLGKFAQNEPEPFLLVASLCVPIFFFVIDARYNRWYRRLSSRDLEISKYLNTINYEKPKSSQFVDFPLYDPKGDFTFGENKQFAKQISLLRNLTDPTPMIFYGSQVFGSLILIALRIK